MEGQKHASYGLTTRSAKTTFFISSSLFHYLTDEVTLTISTRYSPHRLLFSLPCPTICFQFIKSLPFQHVSRHTLVKGMFISEHLVSVLSDVCGLTSSPHPLRVLCETAIQVGKQSGGLLVVGGLFKEHTFSDLVDFFPLFSAHLLHLKASKIMLMQQSGKGKQPCGNSSQSTEMAVAGCPPLLFTVHHFVVLCGTAHLTKAGQKG